tara:strand:+ start:2276 stop:2716 length:441 start_codon:yes stop_codon:yes gene_type:complete
MPHFVKKNVAYQEYFIHNWVYNLIEFLNKKKETQVYIKVPKIVSYDEKSKTLTMQQINGDNLSNIYGDNFNQIPKEYILKIRNFVQILDAYLIDYTDITGYNFMLANKKLYMIDFGHAKCRDRFTKTDNFVSEFINGLESWNPEFA